MKTFDEIFEKLNKYQKEAVMDESMTTLVNANVGSGKTTVLITKVFYQHFQKKVDFKDMVVLTFTNKASAEIKTRITDIDVNIKDEDMPYFGTFHSVALKMLKSILPLEDLGYTTEFTVMDPEELLEMALELISINGFKIKYKNKLRKRFDGLKTGKTSYALMKYDDDIEALWDAVCLEKKKQNKMDFDDLIINTKRLLETVTFSAKWIIIDEFQDCDENQLEFIKALKGEETKVFAVGDPNQIIYTWRGSKSDIFSEFKKQYEAKEFTLPVNYRSSTTILNAAKCLLSDGTELQGTREAGNPIELLNHYNPFIEADYLTDKIGELHNNGVSYNDIAVFYRMQKQSQIIEEVFQRMLIPFEVSVRKTFSDIPVLRWFINLLKAAVNENDTGNLVSVLKDKTFGQGLTKAKIKKVVYDKSEESSSLCNKIRGFEMWCQIQTAPCKLYDYFDLDSCISPTSASYGTNKEYLNSFTNKIFEYIDHKGCSILEGIKDFINFSALYGVDILKDNIHKSEDSVKLMTLHACKGLEFKYVFIIGVNYGLIPLLKDDIEELDEEKRLFFVGITRAIDNLEISYYTSPESPRVISGPSNFLTMLPKHLINIGDKIDAKSDLKAFRREIKNNIEKGLKNEEINPEEVNPDEINTVEINKHKINSENMNPDEINTEEINEVEINAEKIRTVRHARYGIGTVESEDDNTIVVIFEGYGRKEFDKGFDALEFL